MKRVAGCGFRWIKGFVASVLLASTVCAGAQQGWVVRPEWVRAHEEFLASDALAGRGSATRDEQIAAEYVASEFVAYGLKPAPGTAGMIQAADVVAPELDGKATLTAGGVSLAEGTDLRVLMPSGAGANGPLLRLAAADAPHANIPKGAIVLLTDLPPNSNGLRNAFSCGDRVLPRCSSLRTTHCGRIWRRIPTRIHCYGWTRSRATPRSCRRRLPP